MTDQLPLWLAPPPAQADGLYLFAYPDEAALHAIEEAASDLRARHGLIGKRLPRDRLHMTLLHIGHYDGLPEGIVAKAREAAAQVHAAPFAVMLDEAMTFNRSLAVVLACSDDLPALADLRDQAYRRMRDAGLRPRTNIVNPHVTLMYDSRVVAPEAIAPVRWAVRDFVLVHSLVGQGRHIELGRWTLG